MCLQFNIQNTGQVLTPGKAPTLPLQPGIPAPTAEKLWPWDTWLLSCLGNVKVVMWEPRPLPPFLRKPRPKDLNGPDSDAEHQIPRVTLAKKQP